MTDTNNPKRRALVMALSGISLSTVGEPASAGSSSSDIRRRSLVVYFSRSGNTRVIAELLQRTLKADIFEIRTERPYPADYLETVEKARRERDSDLRPKLLESVGDMASYDTIYLAFPIWGETAPPVIRSFLATHDLARKRLVPVVTHGGYGLGDSMDVLHRHAPAAELVKGFTLEADQERRTMNQVLGWLDTFNAAS